MRPITCLPLCPVSLPLCFASVLFLCSVISVFCYASYVHCLLLFTRSMTSQHRVIMHFDCGCANWGLCTVRVLGNVYVRVVCVCARVRALSPPRRSTFLHAVSTPHTHTRTPHIHQARCRSRRWSRKGAYNPHHRSGRTVLVAGTQRVHVVPDLSCVQLISCVQLTNSHHLTSCATLFFPQGKTNKVGKVVLTYATRSLWLEECLFFAIGLHLLQMFHSSGRAFPAVSHCGPNSVWRYMLFPSNLDGTVPVSKSSFSAMMLLLRGVVKGAYPNLHKLLHLGRSQGAKKIALMFKNTADAVRVSYPSHPVSTNDAPYVGIHILGSSVHVRVCANIANNPDPKPRTSYTGIAAARQLGFKTYDRFRIMLPHCPAV
jgi:hypothetical protein